MGFKKIEDDRHKFTMQDGGNEMRVSEIVQIYFQSDGDPYEITVRLLPELHKSQLEELDQQVHDHLADWDTYRKPTQEELEDFFKEEAK